MAKPAPMGVGHNGFSFETRSDIPQDVPKLFYIKLSIQDILDDILKIPAAERGLYATALFVMYKNMAMLPADDKQASMAVGMDVRQYRGLKDRLVARGLLYERPSGRVSNRRFEAEICAYVTEFKNRQEAAIERERKRKEARNAEATDRTSPTLPGDFSDTSPTLLREVSDISPTSPGEMRGDFPKKPSEINRRPTTTKPQPEQSNPVLTSYKLLATSYSEEEEEGARARERWSDERPIPWAIGADGSFSGTAFEAFTPDEIAKLRSGFPNLEFPADLVLADQFLAAAFAKETPPPPIGSQDRHVRLHAWLAKRNREAGATLKAAREAVAAKAAINSPDCYFEEDRLQVANGFKTDLLAEVDGDERRLRRTLDKVAASVPIDLRGAALKKAVRGQFARHVDWTSHDERKTAAFEKRGSRPPSAGPSGTIETEEQRTLRMLGEIREREQASTKAR